MSLFNGEKLFGLITFKLMHPLQERVAQLHICPACHTKTLLERSRSPGNRWLQCSACKVVWCLNESP